MRSSRSDSAGGGRRVDQWSAKLSWLTPLFAATVAGAALALGAGAAVAAVTAVFAGSGVFVTSQLVARRVHQDFTLPLAELMDAAADERTERLPEVGGHAVAGMARRLNGLLFSAFESNRQSQAQLMSVEAAFDRIQSVLHSLDEAVIVTDRRDRAILANPAARELLTRTDFEGRPVAEVLPGALSRTAAERAAAAAEKGDDESIRVDHGRRTFDVQVLAMRARGSTSDQGQVITIRDVTHEAEVARLKDGILSSVSHEMRTPLTNICAFAELLATIEPGAAEWPEFLNIVQDEGNRLSNLVDGLLEFVRVGSGAAIWTVSDFDMRDVVTATVVDPDGVEVIGPSCGARADQDGCSRVLSHFLDNAKKFGEGGPVVVEIKPGDGQVAVGVHDSGPGVPAGAREAVFEHLRQLGDTLTAKPPGIGLGLAVCREIVEQLGGRAWCDASERTGGAVFWFQVPAGPELAVPTNSEVAPSSSDR